MYYLIFILFFTIISCEKCDVICSSTPCFSTILTTTTYNLDILGENGCIFDLLYTSTPNIKRDTLIFDSQVNRKKFDEFRRFYLQIQKLNVKYNEKSCGIKPILGMGSDICIGNSNDTTQLIDIQQVISIYDFLNNDHFEIEVPKKTNTSIITDINIQIKMIETYLLKGTNKNKENILEGTHTLSDGSTYVIGSITPMINDLLQFPFEINYSFLNNSFEHCGIYTIEPFNIQHNFNMFCDECITKSDNYYLENIQDIELSICKDIINLKRSITNSTNKYGYTFVIENSETILSSIYKTQTNVVKKIDVELKPYLNFCFIKIVNITNDLERVYCSIYGKQTGQLYHEKNYNGYLRLYKNFTRIFPNCENTEIRCNFNTKVNYFILPDTKLVLKNDIVINVSKKVKSKIGWFLFFQIPQSVLFWINKIWDFFLMFLPHLILSIMCFIYTRYQIKKLHQHLDKYERL